MKILYITYEDISTPTGVSKKIKAQCDGFRANGCEVDLYSIKYGNNLISALVNGKQIYSYGTGKKRVIYFRSRFRHITKYALKHHIELVYVRYAPDNPLMIFLFKELKANGIKVLVEIPTYPYDLESIKFQRGLKFMYWMEKITRRYLKCYVDRIVTVQNFEKIFDIHTIKISNGIDMASVPLRKEIAHSEINFVGVANIQFWHGYDRLINGIGDYYEKGGNEDIHFFIIGNTPNLIKELKDLAFSRHVENRIHFEGYKNGADMDEFFNTADLGIGSLGGHRKNLKDAKPLKCVEYAARGIPFIYSEQNSDFDKTSFVMRVSQDDTSIDVENLLKFISRIKYTPTMIRKYVEDNLTWTKQMKRILGNGL